MNKTIFDAIEEEMLANGEFAGEDGFFKAAELAPEFEEKSILKTLGEYGKSALKGAVEGVSRLGTMMSPMYQTPRIKKGKLEFGKSPEQQLQEQTEALEQLLPTKEEGFIQKGLRRGLREAPSAIAFPGAPLQAGTRALGAGVLGQTAEELGAPEWVQAAAEITAYLGPDLTKKLISSGKNKEIIDAARKFGMTDEQITPLLQSEFKQKWLSKLAPKRGSTQKALAETKKGLGGIYNYLNESKAAGKEISEQANGRLINSLFHSLEDMPREVQGKISKDLNDLLNNKITGQSLINFYQDVNHALSDNKKQLSRLKGPIKEALSSLSAELGKDFELTNQMYSKYSQIAGRLKPTLVSDLMSAAETLGLLGGITMGYVPSISGILAEKSLRKLSQQLLINPRLQQLSKKMVHAMNDNKYRTVKKLTEAFSNQLRKTVPEASEILDQITEEELRDFLNHSGTANTE